MLPDAQVNNETRSEVLKTLNKKESTIDLTNSKKLINRSFSFSTFILNCESTRVYDYQIEQQLSGSRISVESIKFKPPPLDGVESHNRISGRDWLGEQDAVIAVTD